ncbi:MAG: hypothetical protein QXK39_01785, partial [Nitrososphaerota archaeon]
AAAIGRPDKARSYRTMIAKNLIMNQAFLSVAVAPLSGEPSTPTKAIFLVYIPTATVLASGVNVVFYLTTVNPSHLASKKYWP